VPRRSTAQRAATAGAELRSLPTWEAGSIDVPFVVARMDELIEQDTAWDEHAHPTHELLWNATGFSELTVGRRTWTVSPTLGMWLPAGTVHRGYAPAGTRYCTAQFSVTAAPALAEGPVAVEITPLLRALLERLDDAALAPESLRLTEAMLIDVLRPAAHELLVDMPTQGVLAPIVAALDRDPGDERGLPAWAELAGVSVRTLSRAFRDETGMSFSDWIARLRAQRAIAMLAAGIHPVDVAERVGYRSVSAFGAALRRTTGLTPGAFRRD
jgi:AraC-like DNA-binding protein